jgi:hypothetical protein
LIGRYKSASNRYATTISPISPNAPMFLEQTCLGRFICVSVRIQNRKKRYSYLATVRGYYLVYGARPLKRLIQQELETPIAKLLIKGELRDGDTASVDAQNGELVVVPTVASRVNP